MKTVIKFFFIALCLICIFALSACDFDAPEEKAESDLPASVNEHLHKDPAAQTDAGVLCARVIEHEIGEDDGDCTTPIKCVKCQTVVVEARAHNFSDECDANEEGHYHSCVNEGCTVYKPIENHTGGIATCVRGKLCEICDYEYTEPNVRNHVNFDEISGECACGKMAEARIGDVAYETLDEAVDNWQDGATLVLLKDIVTDSSIYISDKTVTLDLNGKKIQYIDGILDSFITVLSTGDLTIQDNVGGGSVVGTECAVDVYGDFSISSGELSSRTVIKARFSSDVNISGNAVINSVNDNVDTQGYSIEVFEGANVIVSGTSALIGEIKLDDGSTASVIIDQE